MLTPEVAPELPSAKALGVVRVEVGPAAALVIPARPALGRRLVREVLVDARREFEI
jgi:hypothetical protein